MTQYKDVMQAAERIFEGKFDHIQDDDDAKTPPSKAPARRPIVSSIFFKDLQRLITPSDT